MMMWQALSHDDKNVLHILDRIYICLPNRTRKVYRRREKKMAVFWGAALCSLVQVYRHFRGASCLPHQGTALMMEAASISETSVKLYQTTQCNTPEDSHLHTHHHKNLKYYTEESRFAYLTCLPRSAFYQLHYWKNSITMENNGNNFFCFTS
jgi:hypothetical protein